MCAQDRELLTVHELVYGSGLDVRLAGGAAALHRRIDAVHISENADVLKWIPRGTLLLTTGARIKSRHQTGVVLLRDLMRTGMSGLLLSFGVHLSKVPTDMVEEANKIRFPLLYTPSDVPLRAVTGYVNDALASYEMHRLRRSVSLQSELVGMLGHEQGAQELAFRLSQLLGQGIVLLQASGNVEAASGLEPFSLTGEAVRDMLPEAVRAHDADSQHVVTLQGHLVSYLPIRVDGAAEAFLAVVHRDSCESIPEFEADTLAFAERMLTAFLQSKRSQTAPSHAAASRLLETLVSGHDLPDRLEEELSTHGISLAATSRVGILRSETSRDGAEQTAATRHEASLLAYAEQLRVPCLATTLDEEVVFLTSLDSSSVGLDERGFFAGVLSWIARQLGDEQCAIGLSEPLTALGSLTSSLSQALQALPKPSSPRLAAGVFFFEDLGATTAALDALPEDHLVALKARVVDPLVAHDVRYRSHLYDTLATYLNFNRSLTQTTERLCLHRNSLRYRLVQIERILGLSLRSVDDTVTISLGLRASEILASRSGRDGRR